MREVTHGAHRAKVAWARKGEAFVDQRYSRDHTWSFDGGAIVHASASQGNVEGPHVDAALVDPEEGFLAALASCHMLFFLSFAARKGFVVDAYEDQPEGVLAARDDGKKALRDIVLHPRARFAGRTPDPSELETLHAQAHHACFLSNSLREELHIDLAG